MPELTEESAGKGLKVIVGIAAAIIVPFAAPAIAGAIGLSGAIGSVLGSSAFAVTAGHVIGGALVGAALGAGTAALTGSNIGQGALFGALGGGIGGFTAGHVAAGLNTATAGTAATAPIAAATTAPGTVAGAAGLTGASGADFAAWAGGVPNAGLAPSALATVGATTAQAGGFGQTVTNTARSLGGDIAGRFASDPAFRTRIESMAFQALAGGMNSQPLSGLSSGEKALVQARMQELQQMQQQNAALFEQRRSAAMALFNAAGQQDPTEQARQAREAAVAANQANEAQYLHENRGGYTGRADYAKRMFHLNAAKVGSDAYTSAYNDAVPRQFAAYSTAAGLLPDAQTGDGPGAQAFAISQADKARRAQETSNWGSQFAGLFTDFNSPKYTQPSALG